jgi:DNA polymerase-3 subunit delta
MQLRPSQLPVHLERDLLPVYVVHGDDPLLAMEAGDHVRHAARKRGFDEREVLVVEPGFKWDAFSAATRNRGLFGERRVIDLRIASGKPGTDGARVLEDFAGHTDAETVLLVSLPRADRTTQAAAWFVALENAGASVAVYPLERHEMPGWIASRLARQQQRTSDDVLQFLADHTEGNLLAARQEVEKLALLLPPGELDPAAVEQAVADVARFDIAQLSEAWLAGDAARTLRILSVLQSEGEGIPLLLWQMSEDVHALASVLTAVATGTPMAQALKNARVWGKRQQAMERAVRRIRPAAVPGLLMEVAQLDAIAKGVGEGDAWERFDKLALRLCSGSS